MAIFRLERLLAGTAVAIALAASGPAAFAQSLTPTTSAVESKVPVPEATNVAPPSQRDVETTASTPQTMNPPATPPLAGEQKSAETKPLESRPMESRPADSQNVDTKPVEAPKAAETKPVEVKPVEAAKAPEVKAPETASADAVTEKLRDMFAAKGDRVFLKASDRSGAEAFYSARKFAPIWTTNAGANDRAKAAVAYLSKVDADGLDPADYPIPTFKAGMDAAALADAEAKLTASVLAYARHAATGRVAYSRVSADITYNLETPEAKDVLGKLADGKSVDAVLASYEPQHPQYKALKTQLAKARAESNGATAAPVVRIDAGPTLKFGKKEMTDPRVPALRARLGLAAKSGNTTYDKELSDAVAKFQEKNSIKPDGNAGNATISAMNGPKREHLADTIIANMERWRWVPRDLGAKRVILNIPDFTLRVYNGSEQVWMTKVVTGKPGKHATPLLSETMKYITVNPTWNVPPSIVYGEYLPALQQDPTVLQRMGFKLTQAADGGVSIQQPPGDGNALGRIRFNFPNKFLVYQHDTPEKHLFARYPRAYSHGCMRVENPLKYGEVILSLANPKDGYSAEKLKSMYGPSEIDIKLQSFIPVHITYQTAFIGDDGKLETRDDVYGRDASIIAILKGDRKIADVPVENPQQNYSRPSVSLPPGVAGAYAGGGGGGNFFEALFGGGRQQQVQNQPTTSRGGQGRRVTDRSMFSW